MEPQPATMTEASSAAAALPEEMLAWEILLRLPPKSLLRCRAVCRAWRRATSNRDFLHAHHVRQPCLPIVYGSRQHSYDDFLAFDHRAAHAQLQPVVRLKHRFYVEASCDGVLILSNHGTTGARFCVCNPTTRQHAPLPQLSGFALLGMYPHRSTGEYRLLLRRLHTDQNGCYVFALGSDEPPRRIGELEAAPSSAYLCSPALVHDSLHWYLQQHQNQSKAVIVFDTMSESFRQMRAALAVPAIRSHIFEMDGTLGISGHNNSDMTFVDIWMLPDYGSEAWMHKYSVKLPVMQMEERSCRMNDGWYVRVYSMDGDVLLLVNHGGCMFHVDTHGKLVDSFRPDDGQQHYACRFPLKQTLVPHTFFTKLEGYEVNASPFSDVDE